MDKSWTLKIDNFAKISHAEIEVSPLIFFVGDNNSGKSYLMSLLWGILTLGKDLFPKAMSEAKAYQKCNLWLRSQVNMNVEIGQDVIEMYIDWFNDLLANGKKKMLRELFNFDVEAEKVEITKYQRSSIIKLEWEDDGNRYSVTREHIKFPKQEVYTNEDILRMNSYICWNLLMDGIAAPLFTPMVKGRRMGEPIYLPASRTGFMLTYSQLLSSSIQYSFTSRAESNSSMLTLPYVDFLQLITKFDPSNKKNKYDEIISFIESEMTKGCIDVSDNYVPTINYKPQGSNKELPLFVASSVVSEISPILLTLKSNINFKAIIIEEPEAHLHPALQKKMAQVIIMLMNLNIPVWVTTHSDTILQHVNNMLKLNGSKHKKSLMEQYSYTKFDLISQEKVKMYQFTKGDKGKTKITELVANENGFVVPTFNQAIETLVDEVYAFQEE